MGGGGGGEIALWKEEFKLVHLKFTNLDLESRSMDVQEWKDKCTNPAYMNAIAA